MIAALCHQEAFRVYTRDECGDDGYPIAWHEIDGGPGVKHLVRQQAGHRCVRCHHPYEAGAGEWSTCDAACEHDGPWRMRDWNIAAWRGAVAWVEADTLDVDWWQTTGCSSPDQAILQARWRILTVHHLRLGDDAKRDLRWWNLVALCQRCHLQIQGKVRMEQIWPWPHSDWFKPYAAGWYAWTYLGEDFTSDETMARIDELLALEAIA